MGTSTGTIRVLLADDHPLVRAGLRASLAVDGVTLMGEATDGRDVLRLCRELRPDVLLLDLNMPGSSPFETVAALRTHCPGVRVVIVTAFDDDAYVRGLVAAGVSGYVLKDEAPETVVQAVRNVVQGRTWFSQGVMTKLVQLPPGAPAAAGRPKLTGRERELLGLLARGLDNARIAAALNLREQTVRNYLCTLYDKLGVASRAEAIVRALGHDVGEPA